MKNNDSLSGKKTVRHKLFNKLKSMALCGLDFRPNIYEKTYFLTFFGSCLNQSNRLLTLIFLASSERIFFFL